MYTMPAPGTWWRRKKDGRIDQVAGHDISFVRMYSPETGKHWSIRDYGFHRKYQPIPQRPMPEGLAPEYCRFCGHELYTLHTDNISRFCDCNACPLSD